MKSSELLKRLRRGGFKFLRQAKGSHEIWHHPQTGTELIVSNHGTKEVGKDLAGENLKGSRT